MEIRPWTDGDAILAAAAQPYLSTATLFRRFHAGTGNGLPEWYLRHLAAGPRPTWDAEVAAAPPLPEVPGLPGLPGMPALPGMLVGWAEFGRRDGEPTVADLSIVVADPWQRRGIGSALVRSLLPRCVAAGVRVLEADVLPSNRAARGLLTSLFTTGMEASFRDGVIHFEISLDAHAVTMHRAGAYALAFA
jgi:GNAT superfamily N-acetyltransferase